MSEINLNVWKEYINYLRNKNPKLRDQFDELEEHIEVAIAEHVRQALRMYTGEE